DIVPALVDFENRLRLNSGCFERRSGAARGQQAKTERGKLFAKRADVFFVPIVHAEKYRALARQALPGGKLRFGKSLPVGSRDAHHFAGGTHFGTENGVHAAEFVEREDR